MESILITGGTGLIGKRLTQMLTREGYKVIILTRSPKPPDDKVTYSVWDVRKQKIEAAAVAEADHIIHLAGANVGEKRWTRSRKKEILHSRTQSGALLVQALKTLPNKVRTVISASAIGWYGPDPSIPNTHPFVEDHDPANDFLAKTCMAWEESIRAVDDLGKRLVYIRTGIVLSKEGGALAEFAKPVKFGLATILGSGRQVISWIHIEDLCRMYIRAIKDEKLHGIFNGVAPLPVSNKEMVLQIARQLRHRAWLPMHVPRFALKLALGEMSVEILKSCTVSSRKIESAGFQFLFPSVQSAIADLYKD